MRETQAPLILVVDDDRSMRTLLNLAMSEEGYRVMEAKDGEQCLLEFNRLKPDLILLDAVMPNMDGFSCCQNLRNLPGGDYISILMITVLDDGESVDRAFAVGATDYITKPISWAVLSQKVKRLLGATQTQADLDRVKVKLAKLEDWQRLFKEIISNLSREFNLENFLQSIVTDIQVFTQVERVIVYQLESKFYFEAIATQSESIQDYCHLDFGLDTIYNTQYRNGIPVAINSIDQMDLQPEAISILNQLNIQASLMIPILVEERIWGLLCLHQIKSPHNWENSEIEQLCFLRNLLGIAILISKKLQ